MLKLNKYQSSNKLNEAVFMQLSSDGELEVYEGSPVGIELYSAFSKEFTSALRETIDLDLTQEEKQKQKEIIKWMAEGTKPSQESKDFLDYCEKKTLSRFTKVYAMITKSFVNIKLSDDDAKSIGVKLTKTNSISFSVDNIVKFYEAVPDITKQIGDFIAVRENFTKGSLMS